MADRGKYIAACLTICRAYIAAGRPGKSAEAGLVRGVVGHRALGAGLARGSRSGEVDGSVEGGRSRDSRAAHMLTEWKSKIGVGQRMQAAARRHQPLRCQQSHARRQGIHQQRSARGRAGGDAGAAPSQARRHGARQLASLPQGTAGRKIEVPQQAATGRRLACGGLRKGEASQGVRSRGVRGDQIQPLEPKLSITHVWLPRLSALFIKKV